MAGGDEALVKKKTKSTRSEKVDENAASRTGEVQFLDSMWGELMAKGYIAGDERWILGEDEKGFITIVRF